jgi:hypothetical protein
MGLPVDRGRAGAAVTCLLASLLLPATAARGAGLLFSVRTWDGEYESRDVPGGVEATPAVGSVYAIDADGTGLKRVVAPGPGTDYPTASPDGKWVYYPAGARGRCQVYRCRWDRSAAVSLTPPDALTRQLGGAGRFAVEEAFACGLSADGSKLVFTAHDGTSGRVVIAGAAGSAPALVAPHLGYAYMSRLSPTTDRVVFSGPPAATASSSRDSRTADPSS